MIPAVTNYAGRQVDIELLQHVAKPVSQQVFPSISHGDNVPRICAGIQKSVQRYVKLLLTDIGSVKFNESVGGKLVSSIARGEVYSENYMTAIFNSASSRAISVMKSDDENVDVFGEIPDDERIDSATLLDLELDEGTATVKIRIRFTTAAGETHDYVVPVASGIS